MYAYDAHDCADWIAWLLVCWQIQNDLPSKDLPENGLVLDLIPDEARRDDEHVDEYELNQFQKRALAFFAKTETLEKVASFERLGQAIANGRPLLNISEEILQQLQSIYENAQNPLCRNLEIVSNEDGLGFWCLDEDLRERMHALIDTLYAM